MHAKPDLRVFLKWMIACSGSVITDVIRLQANGPQLKYSIRSLFVLTVLIAAGLLLVRYISTPVYIQLLVHEGYSRGFNQISKGQEICASENWKGRDPICGKFIAFYECDQYDAVTLKISRFDSFRIKQNSVCYFGLEPGEFQWP